MLAERRFGCNAPHLNSADHDRSYISARNPAVAIYRLLRNDSTFEPDAIKAMKLAYEGILIDLHVTNRADPVTQLIAKRLIEYARIGEHDPVTLREYITKEFKNS